MTIGLQTLFFTHYTYHSNENMDYCIELDHYMRLANDSLLSLSAYSPSRLDFGIKSRFISFMANQLNRSCLDLKNMIITFIATFFGSMITLFGCGLWSILENKSNPFR